MLAVIHISNHGAGISYCRHTLSVIDLKRAEDRPLSSSAHVFEAVMRSRPGRGKCLEVPAHLSTHEDDFPPHPISKDAAGSVAMRRNAFSRITRCRHGRFWSRVWGLSAGFGEGRAKLNGEVR